MNEASSFQPESRQEKLARLLAQNKTRHGREQLIMWYQQQMGYQVSIDQFIDLKISHQLKRDVYHRVWAIQEQKETRYADFQDILKALHHKKQHLDRWAGSSVVWYYLDKDHRVGAEIGGMKITLKDIWTLLWNIDSPPRSDIIVVDEHLAFGLCIEIEEYDYLLTLWGFENGYDET